MATQNQVATRAPKFDVVALLQLPSARQRIEPLIMPGDNYERVIAVVARATRKDPSLLDCDKATLVDSAATICGWNLEIGETAHLVPFKGKVVPIMDYKGMIQILLSSGIVRDVTPSIVREGDILDGPHYGTDARVYHSPVWSRDRNSKPILGVLLMFKLRGQIEKFFYMTYEEVDEIRQQYSKSWRNGPVPPWYMIKTAIRQAKKLLATTPALVRAFAVIDDADDEDAIPDAEVTAAAPAAQQSEDFGTPADTQAALNAGNAEPAQASAPANDDDLAFDLELAKKDEAARAGSK